jgi:hypothetical protein
MWIERIPTRIAETIDGNPSHVEGLPSAFIGTNERKFQEFVQP